MDGWVTIPEAFDRDLTDSIAVVRDEIAATDKASSDLEERFQNLLRLQEMLRHPKASRPQLPRNSGPGCPSSKCELRMSTSVKAQGAPADQWGAWRANLAGNPPELVVGRAESGFYRNKERDGTVIGIAVWRDTEGALCVKKGVGPSKFEKDESYFCERFFSWFWKNPVSKQHYDQWLETGRWHDDAPAPAVERSNLPDDPFLALKAQLEAELEELERTLQKPIEHADDATRFANWKIRFGQLWDNGEEMRKAEKRPHDQAAKAVQDKYKPVLEIAETAERLIRKAMDTFAKTERKRLEEQNAKAKAALEAQGIDASEVLNEPKKVSVATVGRKMSEVTTWSAVIDDYPAALEALKDHEQVRAAIQNIANQAARSASRLPIPGVRHVSTTTMR